MRDGKVVAVAESVVEAAYIVRRMNDATASMELDAVLALIRQIRLDMAKAYNPERFAMEAIDALLEGKS